MPPLFFGWHRSATHFVAAALSVYDAQLKHQRQSVPR